MATVAHANLKAEELLYLLILTQQPEGKYWAIDQVQEKAGTSPVGEGQEKCLKYKLCVEPQRPDGQIMRGKVLVTAEGEACIPRQYKVALSELNGRIGQRKARAMALDAKTDSRGKDAAESERQRLEELRTSLEKHYAIWEKSTQEEPEAKPAKAPAATAGRARPVVGSTPPKRRVPVKAKKEEAPVSPAGDDADD